jgi:hypothetical protein
MDHIMRLNRQQEALLHAAAEKFVAEEHDGDVMKALKAMMVLNKHLMDKLEAKSAELRGVRRAPEESPMLCAKTAEERYSAVTVGTVSPPSPAPHCRRHIVAARCPEAVA